MNEFCFPYERFFVLSCFLFFLRVRFFGFSEENNTVRIIRLWSEDEPL